MKYKLRNSYVQREIQIRKWQMLFLILATLTVIVILFQQHVRYKYQAAALLVLFAAAALWKIVTALKGWPAIAKQISLELGEAELILGHPNGENRIFYSAIERVEITHHELLELSLTLKDKRSLQLRGFEDVSEIGKALKERCASLGGFTAT